MGETKTVYITSPGITRLKRAKKELDEALKCMAHDTEITKMRDRLETIINSIVNYSDL